MKSILTGSLLLFFLTLSLWGNCQTAGLWTEKDRMYLLENLQRTKVEIINECKDLTQQQWAFKEDSTKWSIGQVLEHLGLYERIFAQEADIMLSIPAEPMLDSLAKPDSIYLNWMDDPSPH